MMHRELGDDLFAGGNIGDNFTKFSTDHQCNDYCKFFELEPFNTTSKSGSGSDEDEVIEEYGGKGVNQEDQECKEGNEH